MRRAGYDAPTDVQAQIIPLLAEGRDVLAQSQTGTGKTAAFALPILSKLDLERRVPQVLVLAPTRELAIQVSKSFATYGRDLAGFAVTTIYGGQDYRVQLDALRRGVHVVVGTPGRLIDLIERKALDLSQISTVVLDEADEMLAMGFIEDVERVLAGVPEPRQIALFSATMPGAIRRIAQRYQNEPEQIRIEAETMTADSIRQRAVFVHERAKTDVLLRLLQTEDTDGVIVFTRTKDATANLAEALRREGVAATALNGDMPQRARERTIDKLKSGALDVLTATDVAARGLDVARVSHVFNFDAPRDTQSYIHRVGRTGRAGRAGEAILFLTKAQRSRLRRIERATGQPIEVVPPPSPAEVEAKRTARLLEQVEARVRGADLASVECLVTQYAEASGTPLAKVAAALAQMALGDRPLDGRAPRAAGDARGRDRNGEMPGRRRDRDGGAEDTRGARRDRPGRAQDAGQHGDQRSWRDRGDASQPRADRTNRSWRDRDGASQTNGEHQSWRDRNGASQANGEHRSDRSWRDRGDARVNGEHRD
ncbi:MAG: DEAD/DEAH box helicase, partial [Deltaproteobacteria bacterium]